MTKRRGLYDDENARSIGESRETKAKAKEERHTDEGSMTEKVGGPLEIAKEMKKKHECGKIKRYTHTGRGMRYTAVDGHAAT